MKKLILLAILLSLPLVALAQTSLPNPTPVDVNALVNSISFDTGVGYDTKNHQWTSVNTVKVLEYNNTGNAGKYAGFLNYVGQVDPSFSIGYSTADKIVIGGSFTLVNPKMLGFNSPLLNYLTVKPFAMYSFYHLGSNLSNIKNSWILGAYLAQVKL